MSYKLTIMSEELIIISYLIAILVRKKCLLMISIFSYIKLFFM